MMIVFGSPKNNAKKAIRKIQEGHGNQKLVDSLNKNITDHPELMEDIASGLLKIIKSKKIESSSFCIDVLLNIARKKPELLTDSSESFIQILKTPKKNRNTKTTIQTLEILNIIIIHKTEFMQPIIPVLIDQLNDMNSHIRLAAYKMLDVIATEHPEYFSDHTLDLIRSLHGENVDERVYAAKLMRKIASCSSSVILDEIKSEDGDFAALADELTQMIQDIDFEAYASEMLMSIGMGDLIVDQKDEIINNQPIDTDIEVIYRTLNEFSNEEWINSISLATRDGRIIASSNPDSLSKTIIAKICDLFSFNEFLPEKEGFSNRISIELADKTLAAISVNSDYILIVSTGPDVQIGIALNEIEIISKKIEKNHIMQMNT